MAQKTILTPFQQKFLDIIATNNYITKHFYFTGGTVLSKFYLHHRLSEDFDLFSENEVFFTPVSSFLKKYSRELGIIKIAHRPFMGLHSFILFLENDQKFKIDFNYYPYPRINVGKKYKNLNFDSLYDIAVNKVHTIFMNPRTRDYIDIFFILKEADFKWGKLILDAKAKFDWHIDPLLLGSQLKKVTQHIDYPKLLVPLHKQEMEEFFIRKAKDLEKDIFIK